MVTPPPLLIRKEEAAYHLSKIQTVPRYLLHLPVTSSPAPFYSSIIIVLKKMAFAPSTIVITAECLSKAHSFSTEIPINSLPLSASACHCNSCRHVTGALYSIDVPWPEPRQNFDTTKLNYYAFSANISILFCGTCSSPIFFEFTTKIT